MQKIIKLVILKNYYATFIKIKMKKGKIQYDYFEYYSNQTELLIFSEQNCIRVTTLYKYLIKRFLNN